MGIVMPGSAATVLGGTVGIRRPGTPPFGAGAPPRNDLLTGLASGFGRNGLVLAVGSDGQVHPIYQSNGAAFGAPIRFVPARSNVRGLNFYDNVLYASTDDGCGGPNAVYALDLASDNKSVARFETNGDGGVGTAGPAIGNDGTVYVQLADGRGDAAGEYRDTVVALAPRDLNVKDFFTPAAGASPPAGPARGTTPVVFRWNTSEVVVSASRDGRLFALDTKALGGSDHHTPLAQTASLGAVRSAFASWEDPDTGLRWIYVPLWDAPKPGVGFQTTNGDTSHGAVAAFTLDSGDGRPTLTPRWISRDMMTPTVAVANGLVFALSSGDQSNRAVFYVLDAATGRQLFTSGNSVTGVVGSGGRGLAVANGRVYFTTQDNTVYCFGIPTEH
jgi:outer membrane protein assembly factor BamB